MSLMSNFYGAQTLKSLGQQASIYIIIMIGYHIYQYSVLDCPIFDYLSFADFVAKFICTYFAWFNDLARFSTLTLITHWFASFWTIDEIIWPSIHGDMVIFTRWFSLWTKLGRCAGIWETMSGKIYQVGFYVMSVCSYYLSTTSTTSTSYQLFNYFYLTLSCNSTFILVRFTVTCV